MAKNEEWWMAYHAISKKTLPLIKTLRAEGNGYPSTIVEDLGAKMVGLSDEDMDVMMGAWNEVLDKIIFAHQSIVDENDWEYDAVVAPRVYEGLALFGKYYTSLWD